MVGHGDGFGKPFGFIIHTAWANWVHVSPIRFWLWVNQRVTINLRGGSKKKSGTLGFCKTEDIMCAECANFESLNRKLQIVNRAGRGCKMHNIIQLAFQVDKLRNIMLNKLKIFVLYAGNIILRASD